MTTAWQKGFIYRCHCLYCCLPDSQVWTVCVEVTGHIDWPMAAYSGEGQCLSKWWQKCFISSHHPSVHVLQSKWCAKPVCSNVYTICDLPVGLLQLARPTVPVYLHFVLRLCYMQSHSDNSHVHATAQSMFCACTRSGSPNNVMHLSSNVTFSCMNWIEYISYRIVIVIESFYK